MSFAGLERDLRENSELRRESLREGGGTGDKRERVRKRINVRDKVVLN